MRVWKKKVGTADTSYYVFVQKGNCGSLIATAFTEQKKIDQVKILILSRKMYTKDDYTAVIWWTAAVEANQYSCRCSVMIWFQSNYDKDQTVSKMIHVTSSKWGIIHLFFRGVISDFSSYRPHFYNVTWIIFDTIWSLSKLSFLIEFLLYLKVVLHG